MVFRFKKTLSVAGFSQFRFKLEFVRFSVSEELVFGPKPLALCEVPYGIGTNWNPFLGYIMYDVEQ